MSNKAIVCPECQSRDVDYIARRDGYICVNNHFFRVHKASKTKLSIFLSYGRDEKAFVAWRIKEELIKLGHDVYFDSQLKVGNDWETSVEQGIEWVAQAGPNSRFVLLMTPHAVRRPDGFCLNELRRAIDLSIPIFPVMVEWCEPPLCICRLQWLDLRTGYFQNSITDKLGFLIKELETALIENRVDFDGSLITLRNILSPLSFEAETFIHLKRFVERNWIIERIDQWLRDDHGDKILWITGGPGTGKTALASYLQYHHPAIKAFFMCRAPSSRPHEGKFEPGDPRSFVRTIIFHLAAMIPEYQKRLLEQGNLERAVNESSAEQLFRLLLTELLYSLMLPETAGVKRAVILIDGLDEITRDRNNELASFLVRYLPLTPDWLRIVVLSRYETPLSAIMQRYKPWKIDDRKSKTLSEEDLRNFIRKEFRAFGNVDEMPLEEIIQRSDGNFLYVEKLREALEFNIISMNEIDKFPRGLGALYHEWMLRKFSSLDEFRARYHVPLSMISASISPLTVEEAEILFKWTKGYEFIDFKSYFGSLFRYENDCIAPFHKSFLDWIASDEAGDFQISVKKGHQQLADVGYDAFKNRNTSLNKAQKHCLKELPDHLLSLSKNGTEALNQLYEFLTDPLIFADYFCENVHSFISYWNALCGASKENHLLLCDCATTLERKYDETAASREVTSQDWKMCYGIGKLYFELNNLEKACQMYERAASLMPAGCEEALKATLYNEIGEAYCHADTFKRDLKRAEYFYTKALEIRRRIFCTDHPDLAVSIGNIGHIYYHQNNIDEALRYYSEDLAMWKKIPGGPHLGEASSLNNVAICMDARGESSKAEEYYKEAIKILDRQSIGSWWVPVIRVNYARFLLGRNRPDDALRQFELTYDYVLKLYGPQCERTINIAKELAHMYFQEKRNNEGVNIYKELVQSYTEIYGPGHPDTVHLICTLLELQITTEITDEVKTYAVDIANRINTYAIENNEIKAQALHDIGAVFYYSQEYDTALRYLEDALKIRESLYPAGHDFIWHTTHFIIESCINKNDFEKAVSHCRKYNSLQLPMLKDSYIVSRFKNLFARCLRISGRWSDAQSIYYNIIKDYEAACDRGEVNPSGVDERTFNYSVAFNEVALFGFMPGKKYDKAVDYFNRALEIMKTQNNAVEIRNMQLNYAIAKYRKICAGLDSSFSKEQRGALLDEIKHLTDEMEQAHDNRFQKGRKLLAELSL
jgi:tetratricopeptide (TPR) repeat protein